MSRYVRSFRNVFSSGYQSLSLVPQTQQTTSSSSTTAAASVRGRGITVRKKVQPRTNNTAAVELAFNSVVKIFTVSCSPNYLLPWQNKSQRESMGSGIFFFFLYYFYALNWYQIRISVYLGNRFQTNNFMMVILQGL